MDPMVDWQLAAKVAEGVAALQPSGDPSPFQALVRPADEAEQLVSGYTGLKPLAGALPVAEAVDRAAWVDANLRSMRGVLDPAAAKATERMGALGGVVGGAAGAVLAVEAGAISGFLAGRVLGQYEFPVLDPNAPARLLFVAPEPGPRRRARSTPRPSSSCAGSRCTRSRTRSSSAACRGCASTSRGWCSS